MATCEMCDWEGPEQDIVLHGEVDLCPRCSRETQAAFEACDHEWEKMDEPDEFGNTHFCYECGFNGDPS